MPAACYDFPRKEVTAMTLGQRIQQLRKDKGLSQEALGEFLGVSRQAISKWESDATIPEIDNLIAMSRLFETPVGVLLGVEEDDPASPAAGELTDRELKALESIVERYLEQARPQKPKRRIWPVVVAGVGVVVLLLSLWVKGQLNGLNSRMSALQSNVNSISSNVSRSIDSMTDQIQSILEQEASLLADYSCQVTGVDIATGTLCLDLNVTPKEYTEGMELIFTAEPAGTEPVTTSGKLTSGHTFRTENWEVPLGDPIKLSVSLGSGGSWQTQPLETLYGYSSATELALQPNRSGRSYFLKDQTVWCVDWFIEGTFRHQSMTTLGANLTLETAQLQIRKNGAVIDSEPLECTADGDTISFVVDEYQKQVPVTSGDTLEYGVSYVDNYGRESFYCIESVSFQADGAGRLDPSFNAPADSTVATHWDVTW